MLTKTLALICTELKHFSQQPKIIKGRKIHDWFKVGERVFEYFYDLGVNQGWNYSKLKSENNTLEIISLVNTNKDWLESFISLYPNIRLSFDLVCSAESICKTRSGIEVILKGFYNLDKEFDNILDSIENMGELDEFDQVLKIWIESGHRPDLSSASTSNIPKTHWWWF